MKRFATALAIGGLLFATSGGAYGQCTDAVESFAWDGGGADNYWSTVGNWTADSEYPGFDAQSPGDDVTIANSTRTTCELDTDLPCYVNTVTLNAHDANASMTLYIDDGSLTTSGLLTLKAKVSGPGTKHATLQVDAGGALQPQTMLFWGNGTDGKGRARLYDYQGVTVDSANGHAGTDTTFQGYCDVMLDEGVTFAAKEVELVAGADVLVQPTNGTGGTLSYTKLTISNATLRVDTASVE